MQNPREFVIDPDLLATSAEPSDRMVYTVQYVPYQPPPLSDDAADPVPQYKASYVSRVASTLPPEDRRAGLAKYPQILERANEFANIDHGDATRAAAANAIIREANRLRDVTRRQEGNAVDITAIAAGIHRLELNDSALDSSGSSAGTGAGSSGVDMGGTISPQDQLTGILLGDFGFLLLDRTRIRPTGFAVGEHLLSLSLAPGEEVTLEQRTFSKRETTFEDLTDQEQTMELEISSLLTSELSEGLDRANTRTANAGSSFGASVSGEIFGMNVQLGPNNAQSVTDADTTTARDSVKNARTASSKVASKYRAQHKTTFRVATENRFEASSKRVIRNPNSFTPIDLQYFKVLQRLRLTQERYGVRLCWAPSVRDPGRLLERRLDQLKRDIYDRALTASAGPRPPAPEPPVSTVMPPRIEFRTEIADKFDWFNGSQSNDYQITMSAPTGYIWDGDPAVIISSLQFSFSGSRPAAASIRGTPGPNGNDVRFLVHVGVENRVWLDFTTTPPTPRFEPVGNAAFTVSARFIPLSIPQDTSGYQQQLAQWRAADQAWQAQDAKAKADALAKADTEWEAVRAAELARINPVHETMAAMITSMFPSQYRDDVWEVDRWERIFDWTSASLRLYPSWWRASPPRDPNAGALDLINASWARLFLPIRVGAEEVALRWIFTQSLAAASPAVEAWIKRIVNELDNYRSTTFGDATETIIGKPTTDACPPHTEIFKCMAEWEELLPTDGTHLEVMLATTTAADDDSRARLADATDLRAAQLQRIVDTTLRDAIIKSGLSGSTINLHLHVNDPRDPTTGEP